jgi:16S rRNA processing protein RimM
LSIIKKSESQLIGILAKLHGYKGEFLLISDFYLSEEISNWESVFIEIDGLLVPFFINTLSLINDDSAIIGFEGITSSEQAKEFLSCNVFQLKALVNTMENKFDPNQLAGYKIIDEQAGLIGAITQILDYNNNLLFSVLRNGDEILIPANEEIIIKVNHKKKEIIIAAPQGLLDL